MTTEEQDSGARVSRFPRMALIVAAIGTLFSFGLFFSFPPADIAAAVFLILGLALTAAASMLITRLVQRTELLETELSECVAELASAREGADLMGVTDNVTGLFDRTHFESVTENECRRAVREFSPLSMMMIEVDYLEHFTEAYGAQATDECLQSITTALRKRISRPGDLAVRFDQQRFALLLPSTNEQVAQLASHCCEEVRGLAIPHSTSAVSDVVTVSIGVATLQPSRHLTPDNLIEATEKALYDAQKAGRNQYTASAESAGDLPSVTYAL